MTSLQQAVKQVAAGAMFGKEVVSGKTPVRLNKR